MERPPLTLGRTGGRKKERERMMKEKKGMKMRKRGRGGRGGVRKRRKEEEGGGPFEASHQMGLNSRRDTISLSSTYLLPSPRYLTHTSFHPSILPYLPICPGSVLCLPAATSVPPSFHAVTMAADRRPEGREAFSSGSS
ncbi:unnamed protein product [Pleuronectes platessa]|uniref:Uncharacterized protein n=1 Tax=Pleuronectes platessa TaxID=8262 RepID=A0A9N7UFA8_PLEPL|nr:unnamed protein product [Pleuronectes platessa]